MTILLRLTEKAKIDRYKYLRQMKMQKLPFSVLKGPLLCEGKVQIIFKAVEKFTCAIYERRKFTTIDIEQLNIFLKEYKPNKIDNVLKGNRKNDGGCLPPSLRMCKRRFRKQHLLVTYDMARSIKTQYHLCHKTLEGIYWRRNIKLSGLKGKYPQHLLSLFA